MNRILNSDVINYGSLNSGGNRSSQTDHSVSSTEDLAAGDAAGEQPGIREHGLTVLSAAVFVAGEMAGSGVLALPKAIVDSGYIGLVLLVVFCINAGYSGSRLGDCWAILEERYPRYRHSTRNPYPSIAECAVGKWGSYLVSGCVQITLFGASTVYLLLASQMIQELLSSFLPQIDIDYCHWFLIFAAILCVPMWLGTPKDFPWIGIGALATTVLSCLCILVQIVIDGVKSIAPATHEQHSLKELFLAFGTILFAFGGASTFPTIQNDMRNRNDFYKSVRIAFVVILSIYLPIATLAYFVYGESLSPNVVDTLSSSALTSLAKIFMAIHLILAFLIIINPVSQDLEEIFNVPKKFCIKRCVLRTVILCLMVFIGETIPKFNKILSLVGGSTITLATFVLPPYFYMKLCDQSEEKKIPLALRVYMWELMGIGIVGGLASTYSAIESIVTDPDPLSRPCYWPKKWY